MLLGQFNANQIPYDGLDWVQLAVYFLALPVVAFFGASIGLVGRWRRGGMLWATNVGLLGGAAALVIFALGIWALEREGPNVNYFNIFAAQYRWTMMTMTLAAAGLCAIAAAIAWRMLHAPKEKQPFVFSLKNLLIVQAFAFVNISLWIGLRLFMLQESDILRQYELESTWSAPGWRLGSGNDRTAAFDAFYVSRRERADALSAETLHRVADQKNILWVQIVDDDVSGVDFSPLFQSENISAIFFTLNSYSADFLSQMAKSKIKQQSLSGDLRDVDLSILAQPNSVKKLLLLQGKISPDTIESLADSQQIQQLQLASAATWKSDRTIRRWPKSLETLVLFRSTIGERDLDALAGHPHLRELHALDVPLDAKALEAIGLIPRLKKLSIGIGAIDPGGLARLSKLNCSRVELFVLVPEFSFQNAEELKKIKGLAVLDLTNSPVDDQTLSVLSENEAIEVLTIASHNVTAEGLITLAKMPRLIRLSIPNTFPRQQFEIDFNDRRRALKLGAVQVMDVAPTSPLKTIIVK